MLLNHSHIHYDENVYLTVTSASDLNDTIGYVLIYGQKTRGGSILDPSHQVTTRKALTSIPNRLTCQLTENQIQNYMVIFSLKLLQLRCLLGKFD